MRTKEQDRKYMKEWRAKNPEKAKESCRRWRERNLEKSKQICKKYYLENREKRIKESKNYHENHKEELKIWRKEKQQKKKLMVLSHYSPSGIPLCTCCGESHLEFLCLDHINGGGEDHRRQIGHGDLYFWILKNHFPTGFQVLCHNCNFAKSAFGYCPHQKEVKIESIGI